MDDARAAAVAALDDAGQHKLARDVAAGDHLYALAHMAEVSQGNDPERGGAGLDADEERALAALCRLHLATVGG